METLPMPHCLIKAKERSTGFLMLNFLYPSFLSGTDRNNLVEIPELEDNFPIAYEAGEMFEGAEVVWKPECGNDANSCNTDDKPIDIAVNLASSG